jgi:rSAM/selenodomain-associated transferase 1
MANAGGNAFLILFLKSCVEGRVKTRLARDTSDGFALAVYEAMILDLFRNIGDLGRSIVVFFDGAEDRAPVFPAVVEGYSARRQRGEDLGVRMHNAFVDVLGHSEGSEADRAVLIGSDIPYLDGKIIRRYMDALQRYPVALGPSEDGGYYLVGFRREGVTRALFEGISWGGGDVLDETLRRARDMNMHVYLGPRLRDIDTLDDLRAVLRREEWRGKLPLTAAVRGLKGYAG